MKLHRYDYEEINGMLEAVRKDELYLWLPVNIDTGEVDMSDPHEFDDELNDLCDEWEWRKLYLSENTKDNHE